MIDKAEAVEVIFDALEEGLEECRQTHGVIAFRDAVFSDRYALIINLDGRRFRIAPEEIDARMPVDRNGLVWPVVPLPLSPEAVREGSRDTDKTLHAKATGATET